MIFRKANEKDLDVISGIYEVIHDGEEAGLTSIGWKRGVYPTRATAEAAVEAGTMFVAEEAGCVVASAKIDQCQVPEYANAVWDVDARPEEVLVLHTLVVDPGQSKKGFGSAFVRFYEEYALEQGCPHLRMDTNATNERARRMYKGLGYKEIGIVDCIFNGIPGVKLVCLEKNLQKNPK